MKRIEDLPVAARQRYGVMVDRLRELVAQESPPAHGDRGPARPLGWRHSGLSMATGPAVCDMKAGIVQMLTALELLPDTSQIGLLLTCDEETGSFTSRPLIEEQALRSGAVLVCGPAPSQVI